MKKIIQQGVLNPCRELATVELNAPNGGTVVVSECEQHGRIAIEAYVIESVNLKINDNLVTIQAGAREMEVKFPVTVEVEF